MQDTISIRLGMDTAQSKNRLLLVDGDPKSLRVLDVSLKKAGFEVTTATSGREAIALLEASQPDLIISDTDLDEMDGFELCSQIKARAEWSKIPFLFVSGRKSIEDKIRGLELGVDDYLTKPIYIKEIGIRVRTALQRAERERMESRREGRTRFAGDLSDVGVVDLVQTIELNRKSGIIHIVNRDTRRGSIFFRDGKVIDAEVGRLSGPNALYRLFSWSEGQFAVEFKQIRRHDVVDTPMAPLLMEGMRRLDESTRLLDRFPPTSSVLEVDCRALAEELAELPDEVNTVLRLCDGTRTLQEVVEDSEHPDLEALTFIDKLLTTQIIFAREAPDRGGESEPSERLAHWLSEGGAEDGAAAEDATASSEFAASQIQAPEGEVIPSITPAPTKVADADIGDPDSGTAPAIVTVDLFAKTPDPIPHLPQALPAAAQPESLAAVPEPVLSAEESLGAALPPQADTTDGNSHEFAAPSDTLKGLPVETLFSEQEVKVELPQPAAASQDSNAVLAPLEVRSTKPLGLAERLLSEDSELRASAMHEAMDDEGGKVATAQSNDRNTREYGNPAAEAAAALVQEVVSSAHEPKREISQPTHPERPSKEVDWGAWPTEPGKAPILTDAPQVMASPSSGEAQLAGPLAAVELAAPPETADAAVEAATLSVEQAGAEVEPAQKSKDSSPAPQSELQAKEEPTKPPESLAVPTASGAAASVPPVVNSKASEDEAKPVPPPPARSKVRPETVVARNARKTVRVRQLWLMACGAFALGGIGYMALAKRVPTSSETATPTAVSPVEPLSLPAPAPATEPFKAVPASKTPGEHSPAGKQKEDPARLGLGAPTPAAGELKRKCLETDASGTGKAKAVFAACKQALEADPNDVEVMVILARADIDRGRLVEARTLAKKALATDPQRLDAYVYLGTAEQEAGRIDEARAAYKKYLELAPDGPFARELRAILNNL